MRNLELIQAISAKLCHDLAGSIGALDNCLGLIDNDNKEISDQAKDLAISESSNLVKKIKFYRTAYGLSEGETKLSIVKIKDLLQGYFEGSNIDISVKCDNGVIYIDSMTAKAMLVLLLILAEANIYGGKTILNIPSSNDEAITMKTSGKNIVLKEQTTEILETSSSASVAVNNCREHYVKAICANKKYELEMIKSDRSLEFRMHKK